MPITTSLKDLSDKNVNASELKRRLLIVDDHVSFGDLVSLIASEEGFDVEMTTRAEDFMAAVLRAPPDVIILDIVMPRMDGVELIRWLGMQRTKAHVIVTTGFHLEYANMVRGIGNALGIDSIAILLKPFRVETLKAALMKVGGIDPPARTTGADAYNEDQAAQIKGSETT